jgi:hypothetical protein
MRNLISPPCFGRIKSVCVLISLLQMISTFATFADVNYWTKTSSGTWEENYWSLGVLPDSSESVAIVSPGWKAVAINPSTVQNYPSSLMVSNLTISSDTDGANTLILNYAGTDVPLRVLNGLGVGTNATLLNLDSGVAVENGTLGITNGAIIQDGGFVLATNNVTTYITGEYDLTNGVFQASYVGLGFLGLGSFNQYGGEATIGTLASPTTPYAYGYYRLYGGYLSVTTNLNVGGYNSPVYFDQYGGTNEIAYLQVGPILGGAGFYTLNDGGVFSDHVLVVADDYARGTFTQNGGVHVVTNALRLAGATLHGASSGREATYALNNGTLLAGSIEFDSGNGTSVFVQSNGLTSVSGNVLLKSGFQKFTLVGGSFACAGMEYGDGGVDFLQTGGALVVSNLFSFGGGLGKFSLYTFSGGTLTASNIDFNGEWDMGSSSRADRVSNPGFFKMAGLLNVGEVLEHLGRFILSSNLGVDLGGGNGKLSFANSSAEVWANGAMLSITNWGGAANGGGADQVRFGNDRSGLTPGQLSQIQFVNPAGFAAGTYPAVQLATGEVVPATSQSPALLTSRQGNKMIFNWSGPYTLQESTNVAGPYVDVIGAMSPFTNACSKAREFFRLR